MISFVILHANGHNASSEFGHKTLFAGGYSYKNNDEDKGYMNDAGWLSGHLENQTPDEIIKIMINEYREYIRKRFIK